MVKPKERKATGGREGGGLAKLMIFQSWGDFSVLVRTPKSGKKKKKEGKEEKRRRKEGNKTERKEEKREGEKIKRDRRRKEGK